MKCRTKRGKGILLLLPLSLFLITLAAPVQGQEPGQTARGWHSIGQNPPRLFEGILTADLDLETEDGLVISQEDLRDRTYFDVEQQIPTSAGVLIGAALGPVAVLIYEAGSGSGPPAGFRETGAWRRLTLRRENIVMPDHPQYKPASMSMRSSSFRAMPGGAPSVGPENSGRVPPVIPDLPFERPGV